MKTNFKKIMSVVLVAIMVCSIFVVNVSAATYTVTLNIGSSKTLNSISCVPVLKAEYEGYKGGTYTDDAGVVYTVSADGKKITFKTDASGKFTFPEYFFEMPYHTQKGWGSTSNTAGKTLTIRRNTSYNAYYGAIGYEIMFNPGDGVGVETPLNNNINNNTYNKKITLLDALFTKPGYVQDGWYIDNGDGTKTEYELKQAQVPITGDMIFYPTWREINYNIQYDTANVTFPSECEDYADVAAQTVTITNNSDADVTFNVPADGNFTVTSETGFSIPMGGTLTVAITPKSGLKSGKYSEGILFDFGSPVANFTVTVNFTVRDHMFIKYIFDNNATYTADGTQTADCFSGCGAKDTKAAPGTMKVYSADNNSAKGLLKEYLYHKTVNFVAFGSGMDDSEGVVGKRFRPVSWYVNDTFNGEFAEDATDYTVKYVHSDYGKFTLEIKYVEEELVDGVWTATGVEDVKSFNYSIGPSDDDIQNIEMPKTIVSIIFGLMAYLVELVTGMVG